MAGSVIAVEQVAALVVDGIRRNRLYLLPHEESREMIRRRFERIDRAFEGESAAPRISPPVARRARRARAAPAT
jgi:hypothetical protein